ncbi:type II toxin-antitoxin system RelE/ParE family toxin [Stenotrophomonas maltophilia]|uniref:type II toxin-antitoxin system RelE/ParE family toxin n=1 Tax=Stenotrophomonas maltophilia TaxID=40324 RepID=UPI00066B3D14|nr:type II toxin-antitoxin system RelE/ParE family toxin [Stenotrophomonas maltophilia]
MIRTYADKDTEGIAKGRKVKALAQIERQIQRKLVYLNSAVALQDLKAPPGNRLEALKGNRKGQYSIRINDQYRICFTWKDGDVYDVEVTDYH